MHGLHPLFSKRASCRGCPTLSPLGVKAVQWRIIAPIRLDPKLVVFWQKARLHSWRPHASNFLVLSGSCHRAFSRTVFRRQLLPQRTDAFHNCCGILVVYCIIFFLIRHHVIVCSFRTDAYYNDLIREVRIFSCKTIFSVSLLIHGTCS